MPIPWNRTSPTYDLHVTSFDYVNNILDRWDDLAGTNPLVHVDTGGTGFHITPSELSIQTRLRNQWPIVLSRARQAQNEYPDAVQSLINLLGNLPVDEETWRDIIEEPYG